MFKLTLLLLCLISTFLCIDMAKAYAQNTYSYNTGIAKHANFKKPDLYLQTNEKNEKSKLINVLKELNKVKGVYFMFSNQSLNNKIVNPVDDMNEDVEVILDKMLKNTSLSYKKINPKTFVIVAVKEAKNNNEIISAFNELSQGTFVLADIITGKIVDKEGNPISGVSVTVKGNNKGTSTNANGLFSIEASKGAVLVFTSVGYEMQEITVGNDNDYSIQLIEKDNRLNEIVVTALGIQRKAKSLTYSTQMVSNSDLTTVKDANVINNLNGRVAGITVNKSASGTGGSARVILRGQKSTRENQPLYVIDGVPMSNYSPAQPTDIWGQGSGSGSGGRDGGDGISNINPDDIETISVLKGAAASALYGSQGNNGVILITTKKGKSGLVKVDFSSSFTLDKAAYIPKMQWDYLQGNAGAASAGSFSWGPAGGSPDHVKSFFNTGRTWINSISVSGGTEKAQTYFSYSNTNSQGIMPTNIFNRHNFAVRETMKMLNDRLTLDANVIVASQKVNNRPSSGLYYNPLTGLYLLPRGQDFNKFKNNYEYFSPTRNVNLQNWWNINADAGLTGDDNQQNPYWILNRDKTEDKLFRVFGSLVLKYKLTDNLSIQARGNVDKSNINYQLKAYAGTQGTLADGNGRYTLDKQDNTQIYGDVIATYNKQITNKIGLVAAVGSSIQDLHSGYQDFFDSKGGNLTFANQFHVGNMNLTPGSGSTYFQAGNRKQIQSVFASLNFNLDNKYFIDVTGRNDWSSALAFTPKNSYFYPSVGANAILSEIIKMPAAVSFAKIRAAYAQVGSDVATYSTNPLNLIRNGQLVSNDKGPLPGTFLKPELSTSTEVGTEWRFMNNRLGFDVTWYQSNTKNQYFELSSTSLGTGLSTFYLNAGNIKNSGIEATIDYNSSVSKNIKWNTALNITANKNKIVELATQIPPNVNYKITDGGVNNYNLVIRKGGSFGDITGMQFLRDAAGNIVVDATTGAPQAGTFGVVGNPNPKLVLGWNNSFALKNGLTVSFLINGRFGGKVMSITQAVLDQYGVSQQSADARKNGGVSIAASKVGGGAYTGKIPAEVFFTTVGGRAGITEYYMYDATNVRLQELALGYRIKWKSNTIKDMHLSLVGKNLFFFTKKAPFDPETSMSTGNGLQGVDVFGLPSVRSFGLNLKMSL
ncbi:MAG: TonB-dependent receptor plug [Chitinophagaceae bacterium]|nr:TonB-dependent receptor plug [Chitinophagaceae bacterium]